MYLRDEVDRWHTAQIVRARPPPGRSRGALTPAAWLPQIEKVKHYYLFRYTDVKGKETLARPARSLR